MGALDARLLFFGAWLLGVLSFVVGVDELVAVGGVLLLVAAAVLLTRRDDPFALRLEASLQGRVFRGWRLRAFMAFCFGFVGVGWIVWGLSG